MTDQSVAIFCDVVLEYFKQVICKMVNRGWKQLYAQ